MILAESRIKSDKLKICIWHCVWFDLMDLLKQVVYRRYKSRNQTFPANLGKKEKRVIHNKYSLPMIQISAKCLKNVYNTLIYVDVIIP